MKTTLIVIAVLAVAGLGGYFFMNNKPASVEESPMPTESVSPSPVTSQPAQGSGGQAESPATSPEASVSVSSSPLISVGIEAKVFTVVGTAFKFNPAEIKVKKGDRVKIIFKNEGGMHDWVVDEFNARTKQLQAGQTETIEFIADKTGTFEYYCSVGNHRQMGMKGKLTVE